MDEFRCEHGFYGDGCEKCQELSPLSSHAVLGEVTERMIDDACTWYRHDFGIMLSEDEKNKLRYEAKEWLLAWKKAFGHFA